MGHARAVADDEQSLVAGLEILVNGDLHVVELDLHPVEQGVVVRRARRDLVQRVDHLDDAVEDALGNDQGKVAGRGRQRGLDEGLPDAGRRGALTADEVTEALHHDAAAQHVGEAGDALAVAVAVLEGLGEVLGDEEGEVGVVRVLLRVLVAVAVDRHDAIGVFIDHHSVGVHAEGAHEILVVLGAVDDLGLVELVGQVGEHLGGKLDPHADVHAVGEGGDGQVAAHTLHPLGATPSGRDDAPLAGVVPLRGVDGVAALLLADRLDGGVEVEVHLPCQLIVKVFQHDIVLVGAEMAHRGVEQVQAILDTQGLNGRIGGGVEPSSLPAVAEIDGVHILHELSGACLADVLVEGAAEVVGDVVFAVREGAGAAEAVHDGAGLAPEAGLHLHAVDGALALLQGVAGLKDRDAQLLLEAGELIRRKNAAGAGTDDDDVVLIHLSHRFILSGGVIHSPYYSTVRSVWQGLWRFFREDPTFSPQLPETD